MKREGLIGLYKGTSPTVQRAVIVTATQVTSYDHTKHTILNHGWMEEGPKLHILSSMIAGFMVAVASSPVDVVKTRVMNQKIAGKCCGRSQKEELLPTPFCCYFTSSLLVWQTVPFFLCWLFRAKLNLADIDVGL